MCTDDRVRTKDLKELWAEVANLQGYSKEAVNALVRTQMDLDSTDDEETEVDNEISILSSAKSPSKYFFLCLLLLLTIFKSPRKKNI